MGFVTDLSTVVSAVLALWGAVALILGPIVFFRARKYFPERAEVITPEQLRTALEQLDFKLREATNVTIGRVDVSAERRHVELCKALDQIRSEVRDARQEAEDARDKSLEAMHRADINSERISALDRIVIERMDHFEVLLTQLRQQRRTD